MYVIQQFIIAHINKQYKFTFFKYKYLNSIVSLKHRLKLLNQQFSLN